MEKNIADAETKGLKVTSAMAEAGAQNVQLDENPKSQRVDRDAATKAIWEASVIRERRQDLRQRKQSKRHASEP